MIRGAPWEYSAACRAIDTEPANVEAVRESTLSYVTEQYFPSIPETSGSAVSQKERFLTVSVALRVIL